MHPKKGGGAIAFLYFGIKCFYIQYLFEGDVIFVRHLKKKLYQDFQLGSLNDSDLVLQIICCGKWNNKMTP